MVLDLKRFPILLAAFCCAWAFFSPPASAEFHSSVEHTTLDGSQVGSNSLIFNAGKISCSTLTYSGTLSTKTGTVAELTPAYSGCNAFGFSGVTIDVNGCKLVVRPATELIDISCAEKPIEVTAPNCTLNINSQTGLGLTTYSTEGTSPKRDIKAKLAIAGLKYTQEGKGATPCTSSTFTDGSYTGEVTITGTDTAGAQVDLWVDPLMLFHSSSEHTLLEATQGGEPEDEFVFTSNAINCPKATYTNIGTQTQKTFSTFTLNPTYGTCNVKGFPVVPVDMNSCSFVFHALPSSTMDISCPEKPIEFTYPYCWVKVSSQSLSGVTYGMQGISPNRDIKVTVNLSGIKYTQENRISPFCEGGAGSFSNGTFKGTITLTGRKTEGTQLDLWYE